LSLVGPINCRMTAGRFLRGLPPQHQLTQKKKKRILLLTDGHGRGGSAHLKEVLGHNVEVVGFVKPGSPLQEVLKDAVPLSRGFDMVVLHGGSSDIEYKGKVSFEPLEEVLKEMDWTTVVVSKLPPRFDTTEFNQSIAEANEKFPSFDHLPHVISTNLFYNMSRGDFTTHGLHMNYSGKMVFARNIALLWWQLKEKIV